MTRYPAALLLLLAACGTEDPATDDKLDTDTTSEDTDTTSEDTDTTSEDTEVTNTETDVPVDTDTVSEEPFDPAGSWTLTGGLVTATQPGNLSCPAINQTANQANRNMVWTDGTPIEMTLSGFNSTFQCSQVGNILSCTTGGTASDRGSYMLGYDYGVTVTLVADGEATVAYTVTASCLEGTCPPDMYCPSYTETWAATQD